MSVDFSPPPASKPQRPIGLKDLFPRFGLELGLGLVGALLLANLVYFAFFRRAPAPAPAPPPAPAAATTVTLPKGKFQAAGIKTEPARVVSLPSEVGVVGRIEANPDRRVEIRPRASGVVREVRALLGQTVEKGDVLAILDSPDIGTARLNLRGRQRELATARTEAAWKDEVAVNVAKLIPELRKNVPAATLEKEYANRPLGANRALLLQAYAELEIAAHEEEKQRDFLKKGIVGEHPYFLALHTRESALAKFEAAREQVQYDAAQEQRLVTQKVQLAESAVIDAAQRLRILGVSEDIESLLAHAGDIVKHLHEDVTIYLINSPFDGTIITKTAVPSQKAEMNDVLFTLADLSNVWVMASVGESEFALLPRMREGKIRLTAAAYPGRTFDAKLLSVGAQVDPNTRTVPLLAETANPGGILKLGMFARIVLDSAATEDALTVPSAAVVAIEEKKGVFRPSGKDGRTFTFHPVAFGREAGERTVVISGLAKGEPVVSAGAFYLKSELILQNQTEDE